MSSREESSFLKRSQKLNFAHFQQIGFLYLQQQNFAKLGKDYRFTYRQQQRPRYLPRVFIESVSRFIFIQQLHL
jgi:hypothetical protein